MKHPDVDINEAARRLGVTADANSDEVRAAYLGKVREHPPERAPHEFERVRDAYAILSDPDRRIEARLFGVRLDAPFVSLLDVSKGAREFVGPELWLDVLKRR